MRNTVRKLVNRAAVIVARLTTPQEDETPIVSVVPTRSISVTLSISPDGSRAVVKLEAGTRRFEFPVLAIPEQARAAHVAMRLAVQTEREVLPS